jgi:hypothetical protein
MSTIIRSFLSAVLAYTAHYSVSKLYSEICIPSGFVGFFQGGITAGSPICSTALSFMTNTHNAYSTIILASLSRMIVDFALEASSTISSRVEKRFIKHKTHETQEEEAVEKEEADKEN